MSKKETIEGDEDTSENDALTKLTRQIKRDLFGRTALDVNKHGTEAEALLKTDKDTYATAQAYLQLIGNLKTEELASATQHLIPKYGLAFPALNLGASFTVCHGNAQTYGYVYKPFMQQLEIYLRQILWKRFPFNSDAIVMQTSWTIHIGYVYVDVYILNLSETGRPIKMSQLPQNAARGPLRSVADPASTTSSTRLPPANVVNETVNEDAQQQKKIENEKK